MRISRKVEYGLRSLVAIARQPKSWPILELSQRENIPMKYLEQILLSLKNAGILNSKRGVGGGYTLRKGAAEITVGEVIQCLDGPLALVPCALEQPGEACTCPDRRRCVLRLMMTDLRKDIAALLESKTIEDMIKLAPESEALAFEI